MLPAKNELVAFGRQRWTHRVVITSISKPEKLVGKVLYLLKEKRIRRLPAKPIAQEEKKAEEAEKKEDKNAPESEDKKEGEEDKEAAAEVKAEEEKKEETKPDYKGTRSSICRPPNFLRNTYHHSLPPIDLCLRAEIR